MTQIARKSSPGMQLLVLGVLTSVALAFNFPVLSGYWRWDDPSILLHVHSYSIWQDFFSPAVWQEFSPSNLTPWLSLSFETDLILFGLRSEFFYAHQILALGLAAFALYCALALWTRPTFAIAGAILFQAGAPSLLVVQQLMTRRYLEGMVFCLGALVCFVHYLRQGRVPFLIASVLLYALACTAKEVYVPLVVLLVFLPESTLKARIQALLPHVGVALLYTLWRGYMLGNLGGGYTAADSLLAQASAGEILAALFSLPQLLFGSWWPGMTIGYLMLLAAYSFMRRSPLPLVLLSALLILLPMVPLVSFPGITIADRYLFLPWMAVCFSLAYMSDSLFSQLGGSQRSQQANLVYLVPAFWLLGSLVPAWATRTVVADYGRNFDAHGEFIWQQNSEQAFVPSNLLLASYWYVTDLTRFKSRLDATATSPLPIVDPLLSATADADIWTYDEACQCISSSGATLAQLRQDALSRLDEDAPLALDYEYVDGYFDWQFGPYSSGQFHVVSEQLGLLPAPPRGRLRVDVASGTVFQLRYTSPQGWITYSDPQRIEPGAPRSYWERE